MCGICGFIGDRDGVRTVPMLSALQHRGPDDEGAYEETLSDGGTLWLGQRRLSILDLTAAGHQPMTWNSGRLVVTFNGEVYNYKELKVDLERLGCRFRTRTDTEVILAAWEVWGEGTLQRLVGMFAFAMWDPQERVLWLARDRLGEKPLYYSVQGSRLVFSSELRSLLASSVVERRIDSDALDAYLTFGSVSQPLTLVENVKMVEPGHFLKYQNGVVTKHKYWSIGDIKERGPVSGGDVTEMVAELLKVSVSRCMESDVPVGVLLSGGVDSTAILAQLHRQGYSNLHTFSVAFEGLGEGYSEEEWSSRAADRFRSVHTNIRVDISQGESLLERGLACMDQPSHDGFNHFMVMQAVAKRGLKVALTGQGADELFFGYGRHRQYAALSRLGRLGFPRPALRALHSLGRILPDKMQLHKLLNVLEPGDPHVLAYMTRHLIFSNDEVSLLRPGIRSPQSRFVQRQGGSTDLEILYRLELGHYLGNTLLRDGDQMSMAGSLELRAPFLDSDLVEFVVSLPSNRKAIQGRQKPLLVDAIADNLVNEIALRPKVGFAIPLSRWLRRGFGRETMEKNLDFLDEIEISRTTRSFFRGEHYARYWTLCVLAHWVKSMNMLPPRH